METKELIFEFADHLFLVKAWKISTNLRKVVENTLKNKNLKVKEYNQKALKFCKWIVHGKLRFTPIKGELSKGIANYSVRTDKEVDKILELNQEIRCYSLSKDISKPLSVDRIGLLGISALNYSSFSKHSFKRVDTLCIANLNSAQIEHILSKIEIIISLEIQNSTLTKLDLRHKNIRNVKFSHVNLEEPLFLPYSTSYLKVDKPMFNLKYRKIPHLYYNKAKEFKFKLTEKNKMTEEDKNWYKSFKTLVTTRTEIRDVELFNYLPSSLIGIQSESVYEINTENAAEISKNLPNLRIMREILPIEVYEHFKIREIRPDIKETDKKFTSRPRMLTVDTENAIGVNKHPELLEGLRILRILSDKFDFSLLHKGIKEIAICYFNKESKEINRFERKWLRIRRFFDLFSIQEGRGS